MSTIIYEVKTLLTEKTLKTQICPKKILEKLFPIAPRGKLRIRYQQMLYKNYLEDVVVESAASKKFFNAFCKLSSEIFTSAPFNKSTIV